ncbi:unnamed protein product [Closterium sp. Naga37s-1]|nr:unnamed protein product [Closterium sp. Naga37s-1]
MPTAVSSPSPPRLSPPLARSVVSLAALLLLLAAPSSAPPPDDGPSRQQQRLAQYIVELRGAPLATYRGHLPGFPATAPRDEGIDPHSASPFPSTQGDLPQGDLPQGDLPQGDLPQGDLPQGDLPQGDPPKREQKQQQQWRQRRRGIDMRAGHVRALRRALQRQQEQVAADAGVAAAAVLLHVHTVAHAFAAALSPRQVWRLKRHPAVASVRRTRVFHAPAAPTMPLSRARPTPASNASASTASASRTYDADAASFMGLPGSLWQQAGGQGSAGADVVVGVVGSGIWPEHPAFHASVGASLPPPLLSFRTPHHIPSPPLNAAHRTPPVCVSQQAVMGMPAGWQGACDTTPDFTCSGKIIGAQRLYAAAQQSGGPDFSVEYDSPRDMDGSGTWAAAWVPRGAAVGSAVTWADGAHTSGMAPGARVAVYKALWAGYGHEADVLGAVDRAVADGVDVLCLTVGAFKGSLATYFTDAAFLNAHAAGVVVVMGAGDWGQPNFWRLLGAYIRVIDNFSPFYLTVGASTIAGEGGLSGAAPGRHISTALTAAASSGSDFNATALPSSSAAAAQPGPTVAPFSSAGPLVWPWYRVRPPFPTNSLLKPDLLAPAVDLWSAAPATTIGAPGDLINRTGTYLAAPLVAGVAAVLVQLRPGWSPAQVMSALMTSARTTTAQGAPMRTAAGRKATPWQMGCGVVQAARVADPGLTFDASERHLRNFLAGQSWFRARRLFPAAALSRLPPRNLNRPSIALGRAKGVTIILRTVTSVAAVPSTYTATVVNPWGVVLTVTPRRFTIAPGESVTYRVVVRVVGKSMSFFYGSIMWRDEVGHVVRSPVVVQPQRMLKWCIGCTKGGVIKWPGGPP